MIITSRPELKFSIHDIDLDVLGFCKKWGVDIYLILEKQFIQNVANHKNGVINFCNICVKVDPYDTTLPTDTEDFWDDIENIDIGEGGNDLQLIRGNYYNGITPWLTINEPQLAVEVFTDYAETLVAKYPEVKFVISSV